MPLVSVRLNRTMLQYSPHPTVPPPPTSPEFARRCLPLAIFSRCTVGNSPMRTPNAGSNASTGGSWASTYNWSTSPELKNNEERLAGQEALPKETGSQQIGRTYGTTAPVLIVDPEKNYG